MMRKILPYIRYILLLYLVVASTHCGYSAMRLAEKSATSNSWACIQGTEGTSKFIILAAGLGLLFDLGIGYLFYRIFASIREGFRPGLAAIFGLYLIVTVFVSLNFFWVWASPMDCHYDFERAGLKVKKYGTYGEIINSNEDRLNAIKTGCKFLKARPATRFDFLNRIKHAEYVNPYEVLLLLDAEHKIVEEFLPVDSDLNYKEKKPVTYCILP